MRRTAARGQRKDIRPEKDTAPAATSRARIGPTKKNEPVATARGGLRQRHADGCVRIGHRVDLDAARHGANAPGKRRLASSARSASTEVATNREAAGASARTMPSTSLSFMTASTIGSGAVLLARKILGQRLGARRIVRRVEQQLATRLQAEPLEARRPRHVSETAHDVLAGDPEPGGVACFEHANGHHRVADLVRSAQSQSHGLVAPRWCDDGNRRAAFGHHHVADEVEASRNDRGPRPRGDVLNHGAGLGRQIADDNRNAGL